MILAGDEFGRTQQGNNNAYCQDNEISWANWEHNDRARTLIQFTKQLTSLRARYPILRQSRFLTGIWNEELELKDCSWLTPAGDEMDPSHWTEAKAKCLGVLLDGRAQVSGIRRRGSEATLLLIANSDAADKMFNLPTVAGGKDWIRLLDTNLPQENEDEDPTILGFGHSYSVTGRSMVLLLLRMPRQRTR
jgi:isoamylase